MPDIDIAVPTHNAAVWIDSLLESIQAQQSSYSWRIVARDDASTDDTVAHWAVWQNILGDRLTMLPGGRNLGPVGSYDVLLDATTAPWVMLADPDDIWRPEKISICSQAMLEAERKWGVSRPIAICTDAVVTDAQLCPIAESYWQWMRQTPDVCGAFHRLLVDSPAISSTMIVNRALLEAALPMTGAAACQDWWLALVACCFGNLVPLHERTIFYRRHSANDSVVPTSVSLMNAVRQLGSAQYRLEKLVWQYSGQANEFLQRFEGRTPSMHLPALRAAASLRLQGPLARRWQVARHSLWFCSSLKNVGLLFFL